VVALAISRKSPNFTIIGFRDSTNAPANIAIGKQWRFS